MNDYCKFPISWAYLNWEQTMQRISALPSYGELVIYGAGIHSIPLFYRLKERGFDPAFFCDNDSVKWGKPYCGKLILSPEELLSHQEQYYVLTGADCYHDAIRSGLLENGFPEDHIVSVRDYEEIHLILPEETIRDQMLGSFKFVFPKVDPDGTPLVTIRMTVYNEPVYYVKRALESILAQTFTAFRLVLYENGATQELRDLISPYANRDPRVQVLYFEKNGSYFDPVYQTKYFCRLDADDYYDPKFLERAVGAAERYDAGIVAVNSVWYDAGNPSQIRYTSSLGADSVVLHGFDNIINGAIEYLQMFSSSWAKLVKTSVYFSRKHSLKDIPDSMVQYFEKANTMVILPEVLHYWTRRGNSVTTGRGSIWHGARNISIFRFTEVIYLAFVQAAFECGSFNERNLMILAQNFMNQLKMSVMPSLQQHCSFQPDTVLKIVYEMQGSSTIKKNLSGLPEFEQFCKDLSDLETKLKKSEEGGW